MIWEIENELRKRKKKKKKEYAPNTNHTITKGMFGNCLLSQFSVFKNHFLCSRTNNMFGNSKEIENKNFFQIEIFKGSWEQRKQVYVNEI